MNTKVIHGFPNYTINTNGEVYNIVTGEKLKHYIGGPTGRYATVYLSKGSVSYTKSVARLVLDAFTDWPPEYIGVHINGDTTDNRLVNLKRGTMSEAFFRARLGKKRGVSKWSIGNKKWRAYISLGGMKCQTIGYYPTKKAAQAAYKQKYEEMYGISPY